MTTLLEIGLTNAVCAAVLALFVLGLSMLLRRRPALVHSLWLIVLLMLIAPPLVSIPVITLPAPPEAVVVAETPPAPPPDSEEEAREIAAPPVEIAESEAQSTDPGSVLHEIAQVGAGAALENSMPESQAAPVAALQHDEDVTTESTIAWLAEYWIELVVGAWLCGVLAWTALAVTRVCQFRRVLRHACPASAELQERADYLAQRLGLRRSPSVWLAPGAVSPMLWAVSWRPRLILPARLVERLRWSELDTLLLHELAHVRRRDHWVRWLELVVTALYWWHPVVWWARRALREAEEQCCDAWVVWALPQAARSYAIALLETVNFLSDTRPALPLAASGLGHVNDLKRRLIMIMRGRTPRALTWAGCLMVLALGAAILAVRPTLAQSPPGGGERERGEREKRATEERREAEERAREARREQEKRDSGRREAEKTREGPELEQARNQVREMSQQMEKMQRQMAELKERFQEAQERLNQMEGRAGGRRGPGGGEGVSGAGGRGAPGLPGASGPGAGPGPGMPGGPPGGGFGRGGGGFIGGGGGGGPAMGGGFGGFGGGRADGDVNRRLDEIEKKLNTLINAFERMQGGGGRGGDRIERRPGGSDDRPGSPAGPRPPRGDEPGKRPERNENVVR